MYYYRLGDIPPKRHTQFLQADGSLYAEELVSSRGFSGIYSNLYHKYPPTRVKEVRKAVPYGSSIRTDYPLLQTHLKTAGEGITGKDFLQARRMLMKNADVAIGICNLPGGTRMDYFYKNAQADEMLYVHDGSGELISQFGVLPFKKGDYIVIPRTTIYCMNFDESDEMARLLVVEASNPIETPARYRNELGQLQEHSPFCERDIHPPRQLKLEEKKGEYIIKIKKGDFLHTYVYEHSPLDVVGWDGFLYPYTFSIYDFEPITGRIHQPPPVHQTFHSDGFVVCSFVPRLFDYHPQAIPAPYNHSNIDSDEVLYYAEGDFMSRRGIERGSFTLHPGGLPHGPHPGTVEKSIGAKETHEYAVMIDTFRPLFLTQEAMEYVDENYPMSWTD
jgi:homogentisate 1,2-dioxygenase